MIEELDKLIDYYEALKIDCFREADNEMFNNFKAVIYGLNQAKGIIEKYNK